MILIIVILGIEKCSSELFNIVKKFVLSSLSRSSLNLVARKTRIEACFLLSLSNTNMADRKKYK